MKTTISIKKLENEGLLHGGPYTNYQILRAAAIYALNNNNDINSANNLYNALFNECTTELACALSNIDFDEFYEEVNKEG